jgi:hypothetical protein
MGRDLRLYTDNASKSDLVSLIRSFGKVRTTEHLWDWPKGSVHLHWFDEDDYKSTTGVELTVFPMNDEESKYSKGKWAMHARNTYSATCYDVSMLNQFLRKARKEFGGNIIGDYGKNRYAPLWKDESTPMSRGYTWVRQITHDNLSSVSYSLPKEMTISPDADDKIRTLIELTDPSKVIYNGLIPFLVSILEFYLKNILVISLKYDINANEKVELYAKELQLEKKEAINKIANSISFQDLKNVKKALKKWLNVDIKLILNSTDSTTEKSLWSQLNALIKYRHDIIHEMGVDRSLSRDKFLEWSQVVDKTLDILLKELADKYKLNLKSILDDI